MLKFPGPLNLLFHNLSSHQFSRKNTSLAQFIPRIYNKIIIKILGYFWGVTTLILHVGASASLRGWFSHYMDLEFSIFVSSCGDVDIDWSLSFSGIVLHI